MASVAAPSFTNNPQDGIPLFPQPLAAANRENRKGQAAHRYHTRAWGLEVAAALLFVLWTQGGTTLTIRF